MNTICYVLQQYAERVDRLLQPETDETERGFRQHHVGEGNDQVDDDVAGKARQQVTANDMPGRRAAKLRREHVFLVTFGQ